MMDLFDDFFNDVWSELGGFMNYGQTAREEKKCPGCGKTMKDFQKTGRFGCPECYQTFRNDASGLLRQIHANTDHKGKIPSRSGEKLRQKRRKEELKARLQEAVRAENYEEAARLHKEIRAMEQE
ncbi:MAG: UvrB/UvrC motif-containing protein [Clostridiales bacterium]|nr:UvrB/UvrC motif-containing protein [Clostridiales bacterium]